MMKIGLLSDTHAWWDEKYLEYFEPCDEIWHAGDIGSVEIAEKLAAFRPFRAVYGNIDGQEIRKMFPQVNRFTVVGNCLATGVGVGPENAEVSNATGKACVCRTLDEVRAKFKPGMVLVVPSTSNEMLNYVRDAAALVVEEPGLNSHAAIAGKALLKPTVVGAVGATSHIRDGLMIAVDCAHGSVQRLQA